MSKELRSLTPAQLATLVQPKPKANGLTPCFALAFGSLVNHPQVCDVIMARADLYKSLYGEYQQQSNERSPYVDGLQQATDLLLTLVQALYDTKKDLRYDDAYLKRIDDSFASTVDTINLMLEMASHA
jgi:hypothetical protein